MIQNLKKAKTPLDLIVFLYHNYKHFPWEAYSLLDDKVIFEVKQDDYEFFLQIYPDDKASYQAALDMTGDEDYAESKKRIVFYYKIREKDKKIWKEDAGEINVFNPNMVSNTLLTCVSNSSAGVMSFASGDVNANTQFDGCVIFPSSGAITGTIRIYGLRNS